MRFSINSSQFVPNLLPLIHERSLSVSLLFKIFRKKNVKISSKQNDLAEAILNRAIRSMDKGKVEPCHTSKSRGQFPSRMEHDYWQQWRESAFHSIVARETWTVSTVFRGIERSLIKPELDISRSSSGVKRQTRHVLLSRQTSSFKSV